MVVMRRVKTKIEPRPRGRPRSEQARQEILETAYKLLRDKGFNAVGSHEIAQVAGVSSATLYRWWKSKEEILFDACFEHMIPVLGRGCGHGRCPYRYPRGQATQADVFREICQPKTSDPTRHH